MPPRSTHRVSLAVTLLLAGVSACGDNTTLYEPGEENAGGATTVVETGTQAFSLAARNLKGARRDDFFIGNAFFKRNWVIAPASTTGIDGLGPTFNAPSCSACHFLDGRGAPPTKSDEAFLGLLVRLSVPGTDDHGGPRHEPTYGEQFNHRSILNVTSEGTSSVTYTEEPGMFADGTAYSLRVPSYAFPSLSFGPMAADTMISPRTANVMVGLGLLEAISEDTLLAAADPDDADNDGISGRPNIVWDLRAQAPRMGRFGWKSNTPTIEQQTSAAFLGDIGITSPMFPAQNCAPAQLECLAAPNGGEPETDQDVIDEVTFYSHTLAVPARRDVQGDEVLFGKYLFREAGCASCHAPKHVTGDLPGLPEVSQQTIYPYTDLLLHDMGEALGDGRPDFLATGTEWRTPPLWGLGLVETVNGHTFFLHDGRARDVSEAILWHGGEAQAARDAYVKMDAEERAALLRFVNSL